MNSKNRKPPETTFLLLTGVFLCIIVRGELVYANI